MRMRPCLSITTTLIIALLSLAACNSRDEGNSQTGGRAPAQPAAATQASPPADGVRRITIPELQAALEKGEAVAVDVRGSVEYQLGHIKGAINVPLGLIARQVNDLPRNKLIVTYCA